MEAFAELEGPARTLSDKERELLQQCPWPGNLRQLRNVMKRVALLAHDEELRPLDVEAFITGVADGPDAARAQDPPVVTIKDAEKMAIRNALAITKGQRLKAASLLQIDYKTLVKKMAEYQIESKRI
jgi:DNA-binding NtrC family response regulator